MESIQSISIDLSHIDEGLKFYIDARKSNTLFDIEDAFENNEAQYQLIEGCFYDCGLVYKYDKYKLQKSDYIQPYIRNPHIGSISPNIYVGTLEIEIISKESEEAVGKVEVEVRSIKSDYRTDYRDMLELITEKCTDLLMQANSPVSHHFETDYTKDANPDARYQKFAFIKSIIGTDEFTESIHRIVSSPVTRWKESNEEKDIRKVRRFNSSNLKELVSGRNRTCIPKDHFMNSYGIYSIPQKIASVRKTDTVDTSENRFIKHALEVFLKFCSDINKVSVEGSKIYKESAFMLRDLESHLHHSIFKEISRPNTLKINSPILQRKEGYREILRVWLMFDLAAKLVWKGGDDVYSGGKKDIATLYEYWLFFKLLELFKSIFNIEPKDISELIKETADGMNLQLKQGDHTAINGIYNTGSRKLNIRFNYNRSFSGQKDYPQSGSWTTTMRPDYTLSFWPNGISEKEAEVQELIVHIHFDAKYKVANLNELIKTESDDSIETEKVENKKGIYKNADLLKMHAYKDAIRRTGGAYVLYPGDASINKKGFHEIIPGLGAFPVRPSKTDSGIAELKSFIHEVIEHFINRASQRESLAYRVFDIHKNNKPNELKEAIPEAYGENRALIPDDTFVLVGYYNSEEQYKWITKKKLYNFRMGSGNGSLVLSKEVVDAKYLLLHTHNDESSDQLWEIVSKGPKVYSKEDLIKKGYPTEPKKSSYLLIEIEKVDIVEFNHAKWEFKKLAGFETGNQSAVPFAVSLSELMNVKVK
ncbi:MAG: DUF2357 domain-containing protein [Bacteroidales bacterium]|nr:DUF2357 domain-containing protein [Bacteroidales bacterium]